MTRFIILAILFFPLWTIAQSANFRATSNASEVPLNAQFEISFTVENADMNNFEAPKFDNFKVLYGPSTYSSYQFANGRVSQSKSYTYTIMPTKKGTFTIPGATANINGNQAKTNPVVVKVVDPVQSQNPSSQNNNKNNRQQYPTQPSPDENNGDIEKQISNNVFVRVSADKTDVMEGEQVMLTYKLYYRLEYTDIQIAKVPSYNGFLSYDIEMPKNQQEVVEEYNGKKYYVQLFKKTAIFPSKPGKFTIDPVELNGVFQVQVKDPYFDNPFFATTESYKYSFKSNALNLAVRPLPTANKPASYTGGIGKFNFSAQYDKTTTNADDPITLSIKVSGRGNIKIINLPELKLPESFEVYDPKIKENITTAGGIVGGSKSFDYLIIPRAGGEYKFPEIEFSYFDLNKKDYTTIKVPETVITVKGNSKKSFFSNLGNRKQKVGALSDNIRYIKTGSLKNGEKRSLVNNSLFYGFAGMPLLALLGVVLYKRKKDADETDPVAFRMKKARAEAQKRLELANKLFLQGDEKGFYHEINSAIWGYVSDKCNLTTVEQSKENLVHLLSEKKVAPEDIDMLQQILQTCDWSLYAPVGHQGMTRVYEETLNVIAKIEEAFVKI